MYPYIIQGNNIVVVVNNVSYTVGPTHVFYEKIKKAIKDKEWKVVAEAVNPVEVVCKYANGALRIDGARLFWNDQEMHNSLTTRLINMFKEGFPIEPMVAFMENLMQNPSKRAVDELYGFLENNTLPITPDGHFLAYKKVRDNYLDCHSGTMDNSVGRIVEMPRNMVDDVAERTCSKGLHFCSKEYLTSFGGARTMILKINPRDVVSIPTDYNQSKGRCCRYEVIGELTVAPDQAFTSTVQETAVGCVVKQQDYDSRGRPLSMTKDAIRKRLARKLAKSV